MLCQLFKIKKNEDWCWYPELRLIAAINYTKNIKSKKFLFILSEHELDKLKLFWLKLRIYQYLNKLYGWLYKIIETIISTPGSNEK